MLWLFMAILACATLAALLYPLVRGARADAPTRVDYDIVVYRDQLAEIDAEIEAGTLDRSQADAARAEIHRRMLATEDADLDSASAPLLETERYSRFVVIVLIAVLLPVAAAAIYTTLGSPKIPGAPYAWRVARDPAFAESATAEKLAQELRANPTADGYRRLAADYFDARNYQAAADADRRAIELGSNDARTWSELGEAITLASDGEVVPGALAAFANALTADAHSERARFYVGLAEAQIGNLRQAVAIWRDLQRTSDPSAPWMGMVADHIAAFSKQGGFAPESVPPAAPSADALKAGIASMMSAIKPPGSAAASPDAAGAGQDMIHTMAARLAARMAQNPQDLSGWLRLLHSYVVLGDADKARAAADHVAALKPQDVPSLLALAEAQRALAGPDNSTAPDFVGTMREVLRHDARNVQGLYYVGLAEQKAGNNEKAAALWKQALALAAPEDPLATAMRNRLADLANNRTVH